jgi:V/A-type H+-transporting ATPase subunit E
MPETIENFVKKLQQEGVDAGKAGAEKLLAEARAQAEAVLAAARKEAAALVEKGRRDAEAALKDGRTQLELGARDAILKLREAVIEAIEAVLRKAAAEKLSDPEFVKMLLKDVVSQYARKDAEGAWPIRVEVSEDVARALAGWAMKETVAGKPGAAAIALEGHLRSAGFEYSAGGGKVEVTPEAVAGVLKTMVSPRVREVLDKAAAGAKA